MLTNEINELKTLLLQSMDCSRNAAHRSFEIIDKLQAELKELEWRHLEAHLRADAAETRIAELEDRLQKQIEDNWAPPLPCAKCGDEP